MCNWGWRRKLCGPVLMRRLAGYYLALASCWPAAVRPAGCTGRWRPFTTGGLGNVIGSTLLARCWDDIAAPLATHWQKVNLLNAFGPFGGLLATYLLLLIALLLVIARDIFPPRRSDREGERMKNIILIIARIWSANPARIRRSLPRQCLPCKRRDPRSGQRLSAVDQ